MNGRTKSQRRERKRRRWRREPGMRVQMRRVFAIVDTNVVLDIVSCHDVIDGYSKPEPDQWWRLDRAAFGLRVAIYLHEIGALTLSAGDEALALASKPSNAPPAASDAKARFVRLWLYFTKAKLLRRWDTASIPTVGTGNDVDDALLVLAKKHGCILISNEGIGPAGPTGKKGIRTKGPALGVVVMTTEEFCRRYPLSNTRMKRFLRNFKERGPRFHERQRDHATAQQHLAGLYDYYAKLLLGTTAKEIADRELRRPR